MIEPIVSVRVVTYNHENYIAQCIEGILMQRTDFPFEIIIGEDCSTDRTREIVLSYQQAFPERIRVVLSPQNVGEPRNCIQVQQACRGKYHATCDGDDYWIDPLKLQKQLDFMEAHPALSMCFHNAFVLNQSKGAVKLYFDSPLKPILTFEESCLFHAPTASVMARSEILADLPEWRLKIFGGDVLLRLWCAHHGDVAYLDEIMSVYRRYSGALSILTIRNVKMITSQEIFLYQQLDKDTHYQHTVALQAQIKRVEEVYRFWQLKYLYYFFHPRQIRTRLKGYYRAIQKFRTM